MIANKIDCKKDSKILNRSAYQNPFTSKPLTKASQIKIIRALITNKNNPNVKMVTGNVKMMSKGFTNKLSRISTAATTIAVIKLSTNIPGSIFANTTTATALKTISKSVFNDLFSDMLQN